ncbi:hypothetical protein ACJX0J_039221, partial [Zea mays]
EKSRFILSNFIIMFEITEEQKCIALINVINMFTIWFKMAIIYVGQSPSSLLFLPICDGLFQHKPNCMKNGNCNKRG